MPTRQRFRRLFGAPPVPWQHNGTWVYSNNGWVNTPTLGAEMLNNVEFATNTTGWTAANGATLTRRDFSSSPNIAPTGGADNFGLEVLSAGSAFSAAQQVTTVIVGNWYRYAALLFSPSANTVVNPASLASNGAFGTQLLATTVEDVWQASINSARATTTSADLRARVNSATSGDKAYADAFSLKLLTLNTLYAVRAGRSLPASVGGTGTIVPVNPCGVIYGLDSVLTPTNMLLATYDGVLSLVLAKLVAGVWTSLISTTATPVAGVLPTIRLVSANTFALDYAGVQKGTNQSVSDAGTGIYHGIFSTSNLNIISGATVS